ncbi:tryptophan biosynthesis modulator TrpM [Streptacidiphilus sp. MAP5-3]|uniref:tryptophan biosynthesis modulator TrpM n=1 Tax=unclassified Streptacidiphilus TaxID=2643834 RepID=UPI0035154F4F
MLQLPAGANRYDRPVTSRSPHQPGYAGLQRGCKPRGCRAPARRVLGRRVRYVIGAEPGQVPGRRWQRTRHASRPS